DFVPAYDDFAGIGAGFGFPLRYQIDASDDPAFRQGVVSILDRTATDQKKPTVDPQSFPVPEGTKARYVRFTATRLAERANDYVFALAELRAFDKEDRNVALGAPVEAPDSVDAPPRWRRSNLTDGIVPIAVNPTAAQEAAERRRLRDEYLTKAIDAKLLTARAELQQQLADAAAEQKKLPPPRLVYAGTVYSGIAPFQGTGPF